jgi:hypothetical protein
MGPLEVSCLVEQSETVTAGFCLLLKVDRIQPYSIKILIVCGQEIPFTEKLCNITPSTQTLQWLNVLITNEPRITTTSRYSKVARFHIAIRKNPSRCVNLIAELLRKMINKTAVHIFQRV